MIIIEDPIQKVAPKPAMMLLWQKMRGAMVAVLGLRIWTAMNPIRRQPASTRRAMMRPLRLSDMLVNCFHTGAKGGGLLPWVLKTTPLQSQQQADNTREEQGEPDGVELSQLLPHGKTRRLSVGNLENEEDEDHRGAADWQVNVDWRAAISHGSLSHRWSLRGKETHSTISS